MPRLSRFWVQVAAASVALASVPPASAAPSAAGASAPSVPRASAPSAAGARTADTAQPRIVSATGDVAREFQLVLRSGDAEEVGDLERTVRETGHDDAGDYVLDRFQLVPPTDAPPAFRDTRAEVDFRTYPTRGATVASLDYDGPSLAYKGGVQLRMRLPEFGRGMAVHRYSPYWTGPVFTSDDRLIGGENVLVLWQRAGATSFRLMAPLAGGGMVGSVGGGEERFGVTLSSAAPVSAHRFPLFVVAEGDDPYRLAQDAYATAFAATPVYGRLRTEKPYPEVYRWLGWCSWNTYYQHVTAQDVLRSVRSLADRRVPVGFVLVDDGWLTLHGKRLSGFDADPAKFPGGLASLAQELRQKYGIRHVGVWHAFQGYWDGVDAAAPIAQGHPLLLGAEGNSLPAPGTGGSFYDAWYAHLAGAGIDFVKVDNQAGNARFTRGLVPLFDSGRGSQQNVQEAARRWFKTPGGEGVNLLNCMDLTLENVYNWRWTNLARTSNDYEPDQRLTTKEHVFQNAYNAFWASNFAYPDYDMFMSGRPDGAYHAMARAVSGGAVYTTDVIGTENAPVLRRLADSHGRLYMLDAPGEVTRDLLLVDTGLVPTPLKIAGRVERPGYVAGVVGAFNVCKSARQVEGPVHGADVEGLPAGPVVVYRQGDGTAVLQADPHQGRQVTLGEYGAELFTVAPVSGGVAVLGLLDKYVGPAAVQEVRHEGTTALVRLRESGDLGAWCERRPARVTVGGHPLPSTGWSWHHGILEVPSASFPEGKPAEVAIQLAP